MKTNDLKEKSGIAVILLNYRGAADTLACVDSLLRHDKLFDRLIICDNNSPDDSWEVLQRGLAARELTVAAACQRSGRKTEKLWIAKQKNEINEFFGNKDDAWILLINNQENLGFAAGNNVGLRLALKDECIKYFWLLNNDTELPGDTLSQLLSAAADRPEIDLWGATVVYHDQPNTVQALGGGTMSPRTAETKHIGAFKEKKIISKSAFDIHTVESTMDYVLGASMFATRRWLEKVGFLAEDYFLYYEELDWALRGRKIGLNIGYAPAAVVLHKEGASIGTTPSGGSFLSVFHLNRSRVIFVRKFFGNFVVITSCLNSILHASKYLVRMRFIQFSATVRGMMSGLLK